MNNRTLILSTALLLGCAALWQINSADRPATTADAPDTPLDAGTPSTMAATDWPALPIDNTPAMEERAPPDEHPTPHSDDQPDAFPTTPQDGTARLAQQEQRRYLQEVLPSVTLIPTEKTEAEVEQMLAELAEHQALSQRLNDGNATAEDRAAYVALHREKLEQELALIQLCEEVAFNSLEASEIHDQQLCTHMAQLAETRRAAIEDAFEALDSVLAEAE